VRQRILAIWIPAAVLSVVLAAPRRVFADEWHKTYTVTGKATVHVSTNDGAVRVATGEGMQIEARVETVGWKIGESEVRIVEHQSGDTLELEARVPSRNWGLNFGHRSLRIELKIPRESDLNVRSGDGSVEVAPIQGALDVHTGDGHITVSGAKGEVRLSTGDGHIDATGLDGRLDASSGDGRIRIAGRFDLLNLKTNDGSIDARVLGGSKLAGGWSIRTGDGSVTLRLPDGLQADVDAHTGDGRISLDFPLLVTGTFGRSELRGKINGGGALLSIRTGDGSIRIEKL
jgi:hypothetical protein